MAEFFMILKGLADFMKIIHHLIEVIKSIKPKPPTSNSDKPTDKPSDKPT